MRNFTIYLCGGMGKFGKEEFEKSNDWRTYCKDSLEGTYATEYSVSVINPNNYFNFIDEPPAYKSHSEVMNFDLFKLRGADLVVVNFNDPSSLGTMAEIAIAYDRRIPILGINEEGAELHPWQTAMCERIFENKYEVLDYIEDFYLKD